jgi:hypothetical protein
VRVELTRKGVDVADRAMADHATAERRLCAILLDAEREGLAGPLGRMVLLNGAGIGIELAAD